MVAARLLPTHPEHRQRIGRFDLIAEVASGGMATVYLGRLGGGSQSTDLFALKRLHPHLAEEADFVRMFFEEARVAALIRHPNVIPIRDFGSSDVGHYLVMEYVEGDTLARLLTESAEGGRVVPLDVALRVVVDMLRGLHAAHEVVDERGVPLGLVHRDVSPQNVIVGMDGVARIMDFGLAKIASTLPGTRAGQLKGKIAYMAPEQAASEELVDRRTDVFASGIVLWELLTGRRLFRAANDAVTLTRVVSEPIESPSSIVSGLDPAINDLCMQALERRLSSRIASALEFSERLEVAASGTGVLATRLDVAGYMHAALGPLVAQQRRAVERWVTEATYFDGSPKAHAPKATLSEPSRVLSAKALESDSKLSNRAGSRPCLVRVVVWVVVVLTLFAAGLWGLRQLSSTRRGWGFKWAPVPSHFVERYCDGPTKIAGRSFSGRPSASQAVAIAPSDEQARSPNRSPGIKRRCNG